MQLPNRIWGIAIGVGIVAALAFAWIVPRGTSAADLVDQAIAGNIVRSDQRLRHNHAALLREAANRLDELEPRNAQGRVGLAKLVSGVRYWQVADEIGSTVYMEVERALVAPGDEVVALLQRTWLAENQNDDEALIGLSIGGLSGLDFNTDLAFVRAVWDDSGPQAKWQLAQQITALWQTAYEIRQPPERPTGQFYASGPWEGYDPETRGRMQAEMQERLDEWAIPTLRAAARGEGVPAEDVRGFRNLLRGIGIEVDEG